MPRWFLLANRMRRCGSASTASGTSHNENCGLHTLLVSRKTATTRNANCATRGRCGAVNAMKAIPAQHNMKTTVTTALSTTGGSQKPRSGSKPPHPVKDLTTL